MLQIFKLSDNAQVPTKGSSQAAGYDLYSAIDITIAPGDKAIVPTDLKIVVPQGTYGRIAPRSGLAAKNFINVGAGVIDPDYRGPLNVLVFNHAGTEFKVKKGDRIAQLICEKIVFPEIIEVNHLDDTQRGESGFGSTGIK
jgi:dUTP pyrophosphatase